MFRLDFFSGASERWRTDAAMRARRVRIDYPENYAEYASKRLRLSPLGSFERRRWSYIQKVLTSDKDAR